MSLPSEGFRSDKAYKHSLSKTGTRQNAYFFEEQYKSSHNITDKNIWADSIDFCATEAQANAFTTANPTVLKKYTLTSLTVVPGSNNLAWFLNDGGTFVRPWLLPTDIPNSTTNAPSDGFLPRLYRSDNSQIAPTLGVWVIDSYSGLVMFEEGSDPITLGWGNPKITCFAYIGRTVKNILDGIIEGTTWQAPVVSQSVSDPSTLTPDDKERYIVGDGSVGAWLGKDKQIATWNGDTLSWDFIHPTKGFTLFVLEESSIYNYNESEWVMIGGMSDASSISTDVVPFTQVLSSTDINVQEALETLDKVIDDGVSTTTKTFSSQKINTLVEKVSGDLLDLTEEVVRVDTEKDYLSVGISLPTIPTFTDNGDGSATIGATEAYLRDNENHGGGIKKFVIPEDTFTFTDMSQEFITIQYNGGVPQYVKVTDITTLNSSNVSSIYAVWRTGLDLHSTYFGSAGLGLTNKLNAAQLHTDTYRLCTVGNNGKLLINEITTPTNRTITVESAIVYVGHYPQYIETFNSSASGDLLTEWVHTSGGWEYSHVDYYDNFYYNPDGLGKVEIPINKKWAYRHYFRTIGDVNEVFYILSQETYKTAEKARVASGIVRNDLPDVIKNHGYLVGRSIIEKLEDNGITEPRVFNEVFVSNVRFHNDLLEKDGGDKVNNLFYHSDQPINTTDSPEFAGATIGGVDINGIREVSKEETGFANPELVTVTDNGDNTITISGTVAAYYQGVLNTTLVNGYTSPVLLGDTSKVYFLTYNGTNVAWRDIAIYPDFFKDILISFAFYDASNLRWIFLQETHGLMQWQSHKEFHEVIGTYKESGGTSSGVVLNSTVDAERRPDISQTIILDEDKPTTLGALTSKIYSIGHNSGTGTFQWELAQSDIIPLSTNQPYYNQYIDPNWVQTPMPANSLATVWLIALPVSEGADNEYRYLFVQPQWVTQAKNQLSGELLIAKNIEENRNPSELNLTSITSIIPEFIAITRYTIQYTGGNWTIQDTIYLTGNKFSQIGSPAGNFLSNVSVDGTNITGTGVTTDPLIGKTPDWLPENYYYKNNTVVYDNILYRIVDNYTSSISASGDIINGDIEPITTKVGLGISGEGTSLNPLTNDLVTGSSNYSQIPSTGYQYFPQIVNQDSVDDRRLTGKGLWERCAVANTSLGQGTWVSANAPGALTNNLGNWDANSNTPVIVSGIGIAGDWYTVSVKNTVQRDIDGITTWEVGDYIWFDGSTNTWQKINNQVGATLSIGGITGSIQYNNNGSLAGSSTFLYSGGNLNLGSGSYAWQANGRVIDLGTQGTFMSSSGATHVGHNYYVNTSSINVYKALGFAARYYALGTDGSHHFQVAPSGTAGNPITFSDAFVINNSGTMDLYGIASYNENKTFTDDKQLVAKKYVDDTLATSIEQVSGDLTYLLDQKSSKITTIKEITEENYSISLEDIGVFILINSSSPVTITINPDSISNLPIGSQIDLQQIGDGQVSFVAGEGVIIYSKNSYKKTSAQFVGVSLVKINNNLWSLFGDLSE